MKKQLSLIALALVLIAGPDCKKKTKVTEPTPKPTPATEPASGPANRLKFKTVKVTKERIQLEEGKVVLFETNSDQLAASSSEILDEVAAVMTENTTIKIRVEGHTDDVGDDKKNLDLSKRRAASVKKYLEGKGIAADRVASEGCGEASPLADNKTDDGKTKNRRVEFVILATGSEPVCKAYQAQ